MKTRIIIISLLVLSSCDESQIKIQKDLEKTIQDGINSISSNPSLPLEEIKKLSQLEYKSLTFPVDTSPQKMEEELNTLGKDRWDCRSIFPRPRTAPEKPEIVVVCQRTPETVLRYVPKGMIGR